MRPHRIRKSMAGRRPLRRQKKSITGLHPAVVAIALGATLFGLLCIWLTFGWATEISYLLAVVSVFALIFFATLLLPLSYTVEDRRWQQRRTSFMRFLKEQVPLQEDRISGREALLQIALLPVALAFAFAAIGLIWTLLH